MGLIYFFIGMTALDFFLDFCLLIVFLIVINALYIAYFYPVGSGAPRELHCVCQQMFESGGDDGVQVIP